MLGPLLAAIIVVSRGLGHIAWFSLLALVGVIVLWKIGTWQRNNYHRIVHKAHQAGHRHLALPRSKVILSLGVLVALVFSKYVI